jgi:uncharacterized coiled-coil DUF342 family protein
MASKARVTKNSAADDLMQRAVELRESAQQIYSKSDELHRRVEDVHARADRLHKKMAEEPPQSKANKKRGKI